VSLLRSTDAQVMWEDLPLVPNYCKAHGVLMATTFIIVLPLGTFLIRLVNSTKRVWIHAAVQIFGVTLMTAGLAMGIRLGKILDRVSFHNLAPSTDPYVFMEIFDLAKD
jgi:hypothetical protein